MHIVKCLNCGEKFDRDKVECRQVGRRYVHIICPNTFHANTENAKLQQEKDFFYDYIKEIFGPKYNYMAINTQAESFIQEYGYTWSGMAGALHWFYNIKHGQKNGYEGIGIIPYVYDQAKEYYATLAIAEEKNKNVTELRREVDFNIQSPRAWQRPPHLLDLGESNEQ